MQRERAHSRKTEKHEEEGDSEEGDHRARVSTQIHEESSSERSSGVERSKNADQKEEEEGKETRLKI